MNPNPVPILLILLLVKSQNSSMGFPLNINSLQVESFLDNAKKMMETFDKLSALANAPIPSLPALEEDGSGLDMDKAASLLEKLLK